MLFNRGREIGILYLYVNIDRNRSEGASAQIQFFRAWFDRPAYLCILGPLNGSIYLLEAIIPWLLLSRRGS